MKMNAILFDGELKPVSDYPVPVPGVNEALIRVNLAGICNTDLEILKGYGGYKGVIGHEFAGVVEEIDGPDRELIGKRIVGEINSGCGNCPYCLSGMANHCPHRKVLGIVNKDGAMAEYFTLPHGNLHEVPEAVSDEEAVFTEPLAAAFEIVEQIHIRPDAKILVMGDGKLGLLVALVLNLSCSDVTLVGKHRHKMSIVSKQGVRTMLLNGSDVQKEYDIVIDASGSAKGLQTALQWVKPRGTVVLKSTVASGTDMNLAPVVIDEVTIIGSRCGPFRPALRALERKLVDVRPLITAVYPFDRAAQAFDEARQKDSLKVILNFR